ncbi:MAG TPA: hypothetical protein VNA20_03205 [Frankiaceae bacterium]|nr:hypothetical protein [Frankiaceae bacterium]
MSPYVRFAMLACAVVCPPAAAGPICQYAGTSGATLGERTLANPCVSYPDTVHCLGTAQGPPDARIVVVICRPVA